MEQLVLLRKGRRPLGRDRFSLVMKNRRAARKKIPTRKTDVWATPPVLIRKGIDLVIAEYAKTK